MTDIDHEFTDDIVCPYCGHAQSDIFELTDAFSEEGTRVHCDECEKEFASFCHVTYSFTTYRVDLEAEKREKGERREQEKERREARATEAAKWPPGTRVRVREDSRYADHLRGREGTVPNKELDRHHGFVNVTLDPAPGRKAHDTFFSPADLERL